MMPAYASTLSDKDLADVLIYVRSAWGNYAPPVSLGAAQALRASLSPSLPRAGAIKAALHLLAPAFPAFPPLGPSSGVPATLAKLRRLT
jgi:hypothetical protein